MAEPARRKTGRGPCRAPGCANEAWARGLCARHYQADYRKRGPPCGRHGCENPRFAKGLCVKHYQAAYRHEGPNCRKRKCPNHAFSRGLCVKHYHRWYQKTLREHGVSALKSLPSRVREGAVRR